MTKDILIITLIISFAFAHFFNYLTYFSRISGKIIEYSLVGTSLSKIIEGMSIVCLLIFAPSIAYLIETSLLQIKTFLFTFFISFSLAALLMFFAFLKRKFLVLLLSKILLVHIKQKKNILISFFYFNKYNFKHNHKYKLRFLVKNKFKINKKVFILSTIAYLFISSGMLIGYSLAIIFIDIRLTLISIIMYIHLFGSLILLLMIDPILNKHIDKLESKVNFSESIINSFILSRIVSLIIVALMTFVTNLFYF
jgi:hypothetical protein